MLQQPPHHPPHPSLRSPAIALRPASSLALSKCAAAAAPVSRPPHRRRVHRARERPVHSHSFSMRSSLHAHRTRAHHTELSRSRTSTPHHTHRAHAAHAAQTSHTHSSLFVAQRTTDRSRSMRLVALRLGVIAGAVRIISATVRGSGRPNCSRAASSPPAYRRRRRRRKRTTRKKTQLRLAARPAARTPTPLSDAPPPPRSALGSIGGGP